MKRKDERLCSDYRSKAATPAAAKMPAAGAAVWWGAQAVLELLVPEAAVARLESTLEAAEPVKLEETVLVPIVVVSVVLPEVIVETTGTVETAVSGREVAPPTPPKPKTVVVPVEVMVDDPLVMTVVNSEVVIAVDVASPLAPVPEAPPDDPPEAPAPPAKMVVEPTVVVIVVLPDTTVETISEVVMAEEDSAPPVPVAELAALGTVAVAVGVTPLTATLPMGTTTPTEAQYAVPYATTIAAAVSFWQYWYEQSRTP